MSLKAQVIRDALGNITVYMQGDLNYDTTQTIEQELTTVVSENPNSQITVDMSALDLVGASGIAHFVDTIKDINREKSLHQRVKVANIMDEFVPVFRLYTREESELFWDQFEMDLDDTQTVGQFAGKKRTFEN